MSAKFKLTTMVVCGFSFFIKAQTTNQTAIKQGEVTKVSTTQPVAAESTPSISLKPLVDYPEYWISNLPTTFPKKSENYRKDVKAWIHENPVSWDAMVAEYTSKVNSNTSNKKQENNTPVQTDENGLRIVTKEQFDTLPLERQRFIMNNPDLFRIQ